MSRVIAPVDSRISVPEARGEGWGSGIRVVQPGGREGNRALLFLLGIPVALAVTIAWQFAMQTSAMLNGLERVRGWEVVPREAPALLLLLVPVVAGLALGVRSARLGSRTGIAAIWLHSLALLLMLAIIGGGTAESVMTTRSATVKWLLFPVEAGISVATLWFCLRAGRVRSDRQRRVLAVKSSRAYRWSFVVAVVGLVGTFAWLFGAQVALSSHVGDFVRDRVPGSVILTVSEPTTYYIYAEGNAPDTLSELAVQVTGPGDAVTTVREISRRAQYLRDGRGGRAVGSFEALQVGDYRVVASGRNLPAEPAPFAPENPYGDFAVGESVANWMRPHELGSVALLITAVAISAWLAIAARRQRRG